MTTYQPARLTYAVYYPRDFANEYEVFAGSPAEIADAVDFLNERIDRRGEGSVARVSRKEAVRLGWSRPRLAKQCGECWAGKFAIPFTGGGADNVAEAIDLARAAAVELRAVAAAYGEGS